VWKSFINNIKTDLKCRSIGVLNLESSDFSIFSFNLKKKFDKVLKSMPEYVKNTLAERSDPRTIYPWAKSVIVCAVPFNLIPEVDDFLPKAQDNTLLYGAIAGYAARLDYHRFAVNFGNAIIDELKKYVVDQNLIMEQQTQFEICVDTKPIAEKPMAEYANVGKTAANHLLQTAGAAADSFLMEIFTNIKIPDIKEKTQILSCGSCGKCFSACPSGALGGAGEFDYDLCVSSITMEKRGVLNNDERKMLNHWIFGCDLCATSCPGSKLPPVYNADLRWLLTASASDVKKKIALTPLNYAGVTLLRRNALAVLGNIANDQAYQLIKEFSKKTQSAVLKAMADEIIQ
jgi:epoxyqueuosine reductase